MRNIEYIYEYILGLCNIAIYLSKKKVKYSV